MPLLDNRNKPMRVGLNRYQPAPPLLKHIQTSEQAKRCIMKIKVPKAIDDPPDPSDEEDSQSDTKTPTSGAGTPKSKSCAVKKLSDTPSKKRSEATGSKPSKVDDSSSEDDSATRGDIKSTTFTKAKKGEAPQWTTQRKGKKYSAEPEKDTSPPDSKRQRRGECVSEKRRGGASPTVPSSSNEHFRDAQGFVKTKKPKLTYKKRSQPSQKPVTKQGMADEDKKNRCKLKIPEDIVQSSQEKQKVKKLLRLPEDIETSPPPKAPKKLLVVPPLEDIDEKISMKRTDSLTSSQGGSYSKRRKGFQIKSEPFSTTPPPLTGFKGLASSPTLDLRTIPKKEPGRSLSTDFSESEGSATEDMDLHGGRQGQVAADMVKPEAVCPWCGEEVEANLLQEFSKGKRLNVRLQTIFCQKHKQKTAEEVWRQKEYPRVEWDSLDRRFALHRDWLLAIINGRSSHFRTIHKKNVESGRARSMKKEGNMNPGYYGPRGFNIMCDYLVEEFGDLLKKKAVHDTVIAGRGSASFIQNVLVAELAVQMIKEDMHVSEEEAIDILEDSKALGELIHEEV
ncbi:hypothetical protein E4U55_000741 [Claviceps digitariae]|nr:hypothetical protein E4U55_000741 [Claviceps digitariae]